MTHEPPSSQTRGPPEPSQASVMPPLPQSMLAVTLSYPELPMHWLLPITVTWASWSFVGCWTHVPHPVVQQDVPADTSAVGKRAAPTQLLSVNGLSSKINPKSL